MTKMEYAARESAAAMKRIKEEEQKAFEKVQAQRAETSNFQKLSDRMKATVETYDPRSCDGTFVCIADYRFGREVYLNEDECRELLAYLTDMLSDSGYAVCGATTNA